MHKERAHVLIDAFRSSRRSEIDVAWRLAESMGDGFLEFLAEAFPQARRSQGRASIMRYVGKFSRTSCLAFKMGAAATKDRSYSVRHDGCAALAYPLQTASLPILSSLLAHSERRTVEGARSAIDAMKRNHHNFFRDRKHRGKILRDYASVWSFRAAARLVQYPLSAGGRALRVTR